MSVYRPYYDAETFRYPSDHSQVLGSSHSEDLSDGFDAFQYLDLEELVAGKSRLAIVGMSVSRFYARMLVSQPFEITRFLLQVGEWDSGLPPASDEYASSSSDEDVDYFVDVRDMALQKKDQGRNKKKKKKPKASKSRSVQLFNPEHTTRAVFPYALQLTNGPYIFSMMGALSDKEGAFGLWKALNASCLCRAATGVVNAWATSFLASVSGVPDPQFANLLHSPAPLKLVGISTAGVALAAAVLTPLYVICARLVSTGISIPESQPRSLRQSIIDCIRQGHAIAPWWAVLPTTLAATLNHVMTTVAPLLFTRKYNLDAFSAPQAYNLCELFTGLAVLLVRMPLETMANRAQLRAAHPSPKALVIVPAEYNGIVATLWAVIRGEAPLASLYRGWRSEVIGLLGEWGYAALDEGRPTQQEHF